MDCDDELLITYGIGYVFEKSKLLIISEIEEKTVLKYEMNIMEEISSINKLNEIFNIKCALKFPKNYVSNIEEALEEKLLKTIPMITSIKTKNMDKQVHLMEEYAKKDLSQLRLRKEGYVKKDSNLIKQYLDNCNQNLEMEIKERKYSKYNKIILKIILTTRFGNELGHFLTKQGQVVDIGNDKKLIEEQLKNNFLIKKKYSELDFLNLILFLEEWQKKYFSWDQKYTSLMFSIDKKGNKYKGSKSELKDFVVSFIKEKRYLYFPFGRYNEENIFMTLDNDMYIKTNNNEEDVKLHNKHNRTILEKKEKNLYKIILRNYEEIDLEYGKEIGYLLLYNKGEVYISLVTYDKKNEKIESVNQYENFNEKMIEILEKHFII
ncbi:hypothetical protein CLPUN_00660 [Clostridium puniceum]|uniref:Uncharacterized protein n=1 Tax=Clostridium puniceum TaxID=29367 RepID=A0A1S8TYB1_9CLOT|nr:hypothetical protein [Clostridium puniceum]OOM82582.1 hypothetical protein CLPUN_00660 [Clostridium puniceum]